MRQLLLFPHCPPADDGPAVLAPDQQDGLIAHLLKGASPQAACRPLRAEVASFFRTVEADPDFRRRLRQVRESLTNNVLSLVYGAAMKGTPAAQALWLRTFPPPSYADSNTELTPVEPSDDFAQLSNEAIDLQLTAYRAAGLGEVGPAA